jgi:hypothetical protein
VATSAVASPQRADEGLLVSIAIQIQFMANKDPQNGNVTIRQTGPNLNAASVRVAFRLLSIAADNTKQRLIREKP